MTCPRCHRNLSYREDGTLPRHGNLTTGECLPLPSGEPMEPSWEQRVESAKGERTQARQVRALFLAYND